jgi:hypothetical protein
MGRAVQLIVAVGAVEVDVPANGSVSVLIPLGPLPTIEPELSPTPDARSGPR